MRTYEYPVQIGDYCRGYFKPLEQTVYGIVISYCKRSHRNILIKAPDGTQYKVWTSTAKKVDDDLLDRVTLQWVRNYRPLLFKNPSLIQEKYTKQRKRTFNHSIERAA